MASRPASRIGDLTAGTCCCGQCHGATGIIITGSSDVITEKSPQSRLTDITLSLCHGCVGTFITSSNTVNANSLGTIRPGDDFSGSYTGVAITGANTVFIGD